MKGLDIFRIDRLLVIRDTFSRYVCGDFLRFRQRTVSLITIIELLRGWVLFIFQEHELHPLHC